MTKKEKQKILELLEPIKEYIGLTTNDPATHSNTQAFMAGFRKRKLESIVQKNITKIEVLLEDE